MSLEPRNAGTPEGPGATDPAAASETRASDASLGRRALRGSFWEVAGYGSSQALRLASNLVLTRLLFPEAFGLMALVSVVLYGLVMLSDVGIQQSIIQNERGDDEDFLNTAWTIQAVRGVILWLVAAALAWPAAVLYRQPMLVWMVPVGSLALVAGGFASTAEHTLRRHVRVGPIVLMEICCQAGAFAVTATWALIHRSVWALVAGHLAAAAIRLVWTHRLPVGYRNRFRWEPTSRRAINTFGRWILGSSAVTFAVVQGDRLLLGRVLGVAGLGIYQIAVFLAEAMNALILRVVAGVFYSVFSKVRHEGRDRLKNVYYRTRLRLEILAMPLIGLLATAGTWVVRLLYDERYEDAGWMLQILCLRTAMTVVISPSEACLTALGHPRFGFFASLARGVWVIAGVALGWIIAGVEGVVWAVGLSMVPSFLVVWPRLAREGLLRLDRELVAWVLFGAGALVGAGLLRVLPDVP